MVFEAVLTAGYSGHVAVDDIEFLQFDCSLTPAAAAVQDDGSQTTAQPTTRAPIAPGPFNCDFDQDTCQYIQVRTVYLNS